MESSSNKTRLSWKNVCVLINVCYLMELGRKSFGREPKSNLSYVCANVCYLMESTVL